MGMPCAMSCPTSEPFHLLENKKNDMAFKLAKKEFLWGKQKNEIMLDFHLISLLRGPKVYKVLLKCHKGTVECFSRFCFVVKRSADKMISQIFDIFAHDFSLFGNQLSS